MKTFIFALIFAVLFFAGLNYIFSGTFNVFEVQLKDNGVRNISEVASVPNMKNEINPATNTKVLAESLNLRIPFILQAPFSDWSYPFNHNCEEATALMVHYYLQGKTEVNQNQTKKELLELVAFETKNYGFHEDTSATQTAKLIEDFYGYKTRIIYNFSLEDIKKELNAGNPVMAPTAGKQLQNPYFTPPGPLYHMLLIKGYNQTKFITNDPGTKHGADLIYSFDVLYEAIHDWNDGRVENGQKVIIVVSRNE